jgi:type I restriction enzyme S subunit
MTKLFFEKFDQLVGESDSVPRMRALIVDLAMSGKLTSRNPDDEPASVLLAKARTERANLVSRQEIKKRNTEAVLSPDMPFDVPQSWQWARLADVGYELGQKAPDGPFTYIDVGGIDSFPGCVSARIEKLEPRNAPSRARKLVKLGTVIYSTVRPYLLNVAVIDRAFDPEPIASTAFGILHPFAGFESRYLFYWLRSAQFTAYVETAMRGMAYPAINDEKFYCGYVPVPPTAEQKRIVAKIDELIAICDRLETQRKERETRHTAIARAAVARFQEIPNRENLDFLFHNSYSVHPSDLRESILSLAIRGKFSPQDSKDEPAVSLIEGIAEFRTQWLGDKRAKPSKQILEIDKKKCAFEIPSSWTWCRLGDLVLEFRYGTSRKCSRDRHGVPVLRIPNIRAGRVDASDLKFAPMSPSEFAELQLQSGDLLVVRSNGSEKLVGRSAVVFPEDEKFVYAGYLVRLRIPQNFIFPRYLQLALSTSEVRSQIEGPIRTTSGVKNINTTELSNLVFPLAPFAEQRRIVDRIDRLTPLVDKLEAQSTTSQEMSKKLLDAAVYEILHPEDGLVASSNLRQGGTADRLSIGCYVINQLTQNPNFGRTMLMKVFYLSEAHVGLRQAWQPLRQAAGPYDPTIEDFELLGIQSGLFMVKTKTLGNGHEMVQYQSKIGMEAKIAEAVSVLGGRQTEFDRLLNLFQNKTTEEAEIIATLFAAWNDLLIDGKSPSDDEIIREVRENWHYKKERFTPTLLARWLNWLRQQSVIPRGLAPRTRQQLKLGLS